MHVKQIYPLSNDTKQLIHNYFGTAYGFESVFSASSWLIFNMKNCN